MAAHADREIDGTTGGAVDELAPELRATLYEAMLDLPENERPHSRTERAIERHRHRRSRVRIAAAGLVAMAGVAGVIVAVDTRSDDAPTTRPSALVSTQERSHPAETVADDRQATTATDTPAPVTSGTTAPGQSGGTSEGRDRSPRRTPRRARPAARGAGPTAAAVAGIATEHPTKTGTPTPPKTAPPPTTATTAPPPTTSSTSTSTSTTTTTTTLSPPVEPPPLPIP